MKLTVRNLITILCVLLGFSANGEKTGQDSIVVSLLTCDPGREIYELCGHEAIRVRGVADGEKLDSVWNYGVFDFNQPNFVWRFVKGETDYMLAGYKFTEFLPEYILAGRGVTEQQLNISQKEARKLLDMLREESKPENREYRYNYVRDNCSTRVVDRVDDASDSRIIYPDNVKYGTFREEMRHYHRNYPWYQFGIDLALGSGIDVPITGREEMFVPVELKEKVGNARFEDGRSVIKNTAVIVADSGNAVDGPTKWYLTPLAIGVAAFILVTLLCWLQIQKIIVFRWLYFLWFGITGLAGCLVLFLVAVSTHEATSPNLLLVWLNPLQLLFAVTICFRRCRAFNIGLAWYNAAGVGCLLLVWAFQKQVANLAFFPMMGISVMLAVTYLLVSSKTNKNNEKNSFIGTGRHSSDQRHNTGRRRNVGRAKAGGRNRR